jgi:hypothetical protein
MKPGSLVAIILLELVALAHLLRIFLGLQVTVGATEIPMWVSVVGVIVPGAVAYLLWREGRSDRTAA